MPRSPVLQQTACALLLGLVVACGEPDRLEGPYEGPRRSAVVDLEVRGDWPAERAVVVERPSLDDASLAAWRAPVSALRAAPAAEGRPW